MQKMSGGFLFIFHTLSLSLQTTVLWGLLQCGFFSFVNFDKPVMLRNDLGLFFFLNVMLKNNQYFSVNQYSRLLPKKNQKS